MRRSACAENVFACLFLTALNVCLIRKTKSSCGKMKINLYLKFEWRVGQFRPLKVAAEFNMVIKCLRMPLIAAKNSFVFPLIPKSRCQIVAHKHRLAICSKALTRIRNVQITVLNTFAANFSRGNFFNKSAIFQKSSAEKRNSHSELKNRIFESCAFKRRQTLSNILFESVIMQTIRKDKLKFRCC